MALAAACAGTHWPERVFQSIELTPAVRTRTSTSPGCATGRGEIS